MSRGSGEKRRAVGVAPCGTGGHRVGTAPEGYGAVYVTMSVCATRNEPVSVVRIAWRRNVYVVPETRSPVAYVAVPCGLIAARYGSPSRYDGAEPSVV